MKETAVKIFESYSELNVIYMTSDEQAFTVESKAEDHAEILKDRTIKVFKRDDFERNEGLEVENKLKNK